MIITPILRPNEMYFGDRLMMDSHVDTICINKHSHIESIMEGMRVGAVPFDKIIEKLSDLPIVNSVYEYDNPNTFCNILLRMNHVIYIADMEHALL